MATTLPGQIVQAQNYNSYMILYTEGEEAVAVVDGAPPGPEGRKFTIPTGKAVKVPFEAGRFLLEHLSYTGVVRVNETEKADGTGTEFDIAGAKVASLALFASQDERRWREYVEYCINDKINNKRVVPATPDTIKRLIARRGYRLTDYGIAPVGEPQPMDTDVAALQAQNLQLQAQLKEQGEKLAKLLELLGEDDGKGSKGKGKA